MKWMKKDSFVLCLEWFKGLRRNTVFLMWVFLAGRKPVERKKMWFDWNLAQKAERSVTILLINFLVTPASGAWGYK